jgi:hypothetical protein
MQRTGHAVSDLEGLSGLLVKGRWIAIVLTPAAVFVAWSLLGMHLSTWGMAVVVGILLVTNLGIVSHASRRLGPGTDEKLRAIRLDVQLRLQLAADVVALSLAFYWAGGIENGLPFLGAFHVAAVATYLGEGEARKVIWAIVTGIGVVAMLELNRALYHWHLMNDWRWGVQTEGKYVIAYLGALVTVLLLTAWSVTHRTRR